MAENTILFAGWLTGKKIKGVPAKKAKPSAYLYGEDKVRLPKLPEWDKETYPYAWIWYNASQKLYLLWFTTENAQYGYFPTLDGMYDGTGACAYGWALPENTRHNSCSYDTQHSYNWSEVLDWGRAYHNYATEDPHNIIWTSHDILNIDDGTVYLAASDPVPVYD